MFRARNSDSKTPLEKWNPTPGTDFRLKSLWCIFLMHPVYMDIRIPSSSLQSKTSLARASSCSQFSSTSWLILLLALRSTFFTLLWWNWGQQSQETRMRTRTRMTRKEMVEVKAQALQSSVPEEGWAEGWAILQDKMSLTHQVFHLLASPFYSLSGT